MRTPFVQRRKCSWRACCGLVLLLLGMFFVWATSGVLWHALTGLPFLVALLWVFRPPSPLLRVLHAVALVVIGLAGCVFLGQWLRYYVVQVYHVPTGSMERTILPGDRVLVYKTGHHQVAFLFLCTACIWCPDRGTAGGCGGFLPVGYLARCS